MERKQCTATTLKGLQCKNYRAQDAEHTYCKVHKNFIPEAISPGNKKISRTVKVPPKLKLKFIPKKCNATTNGIKCRKRCSKNSLNEMYCKLHCEAYKFNPPDECSICMEELKAGEEPLSCGHWFHSKCMRNWNTPSCPICRTALSPEDRNKYIISYEYLMDVSEIYATLFFNLGDYLQHLISNNRYRELAETVNNFNTGALHRANVANLGFLATSWQE